MVTALRFAIISLREAGGARIGRQAEEEKGSMGTKYTEGVKAQRKI